MLPRRGPGQLIAVDATCIHPCACQHIELLIQRLMFRADSGVPKLHSGGGRGGGERHAEGGELRVSAFRPRYFVPAVRELAKSDPAFPVMTPYDLRHTAASLAISVGANPKTVQTMLGHQSAVMTMDTKADLFPDDLERVASAHDEARVRALMRAADNCGPTRKKAPTRITGKSLSPTSIRVGVAGFEPTTSSSRTKRATKLRHTPRRAKPAYRTEPVVSQTPPGATT